MTMVHDGSYVCSRCLDDEYLLCSECNEYFPADDVSFAVDADGNDVYICHDCRDNHYTQCAECERFFHNDSIDGDLCHSCKAEEVSA